MPVESLPSPKKRFRLFSRPKQPSNEVVPIQPKEWLEIESVDAHCSICLSEYDTGEDIRQLGCKHHYHVKCIDGWLTLNAVCPNCRGMDLVGSSSAALESSTREAIIKEANARESNQSSPPVAHSQIEAPGSSQIEVASLEGHDLGGRSESDRNLITADVDLNDQS